MKIKGLAARYYSLHQKPQNTRISSQYDSLNLLQHINNRDTPSSSSLQLVIGTSTILFILPLLLILFHYFAEMELFRILKNYICKEAIR